MTAPKTVTQAEFARMQGWQRSYVTALKKEGRLVMTESGKRVRVAESLARIKETSDPNRSDVGERHAANRGKASAAPQIPQPQGEGQNAKIESNQEARARKMRAEANLSELELKKRLGEVCETIDVRHGGAEAGAITRSVVDQELDHYAEEAMLSPEQKRLLIDCKERILVDIGKRAEVAMREIVEAGE